LAAVACCGRASRAHRGRLFAGRQIGARFVFSPAYQHLYVALALPFFAGAAASCMDLFAALRCASFNITFGIGAYRGCAREHKRGAWRA